MSCIIILLNSYQYASAMEMQEILKLLSATPVKFAQFSETRTSYFLENPLVTKGSLEFKAPATMIKRMQEPEEIVQRIDGDVLSISNGNELNNTVYLSSNTDLAMGINAVRWMLSGDESALNQNFNITFNNVVHQWSVKLVPKDSSVSDVITSILITGEKDFIKQIKVTHANGDSIITDLYDHK